MDEEIVAIMFVIASMGTFTLLGLKMFLKYRIERLKGAGGEALKRIEESVAQLRDEFYLLRNDMVEMQERLDFAERLLTRGKEPPDRTPRA